MDKKKIPDRVAKAVRIATVPPVMAGVLIAVLYWQVPAFRNVGVLWMSVAFLVAFPLLAYPLQPFIPKFKYKGREGQRTLAMLFAAGGYVVTVLFAALTGAASGPWIVYLTYLLSALLMVLFNKVIRLRASGHACGVAGPVWALIWFLGTQALYGFALLGLVFWASLKTKRHKITELVLGTCISGCALIASVLFAGQI